MAAKIWIRIQLKSLDPDLFEPVAPDTKSGTRKAKSLGPHKKEFHTLNSWMFYTGAKGFSWALEVFN